MRSTIRTALYLSLATTPSALTAQQGVTIESSVDLRMTGVFGAMAGMAARMGGASMRDVATTTHVAGHKLRTESGRTATIIDADAGRITTLDHEARTFTSITLAEMAAALRTAQQSASREAAQATDAPKPTGEVKVNYTVDTERPGQRETIAGYDAERVLLTITMQGEAKPEGEQAADVGSLVLLLDQWIAPAAPQAKAMADFQRAYAAKAGQAFRGQASGLQPLFTAHPQMKAGVEAAAKEMAKVQGTPLRSVMHVIAVPPGVALDRRLALSDGSTAAKTEPAAEEKPKSGGMGGMLGRLRNAASEAAKMAEPRPAGPPKQGTLLTMTDEVRRIAPGPVPAAMFAPPADYREIKTRQP